MAHYKKAIAGLMFGLPVLLTGCADFTLPVPSGGSMMSANCTSMGNQYYGSQSWVINTFIVGTPVQHEIIQHVAEFAPQGSWAANSVEISTIPTVPAATSNNQQWALNMASIDVNVNAMVTRKTASASTSRVDLLMFFKVFDHCSPSGREYTIPMWAVKDPQIGAWIPQVDPSRFSARGV